MINWLSHLLVAPVMTQPLHIRSPGAQLGFTPTKAKEFCSLHINMKTERGKDDYF